jgi:signal transduction histidine kinase
MLRDGIDSMDATGQRALLANVERGVLRLMRVIDNLLESVRIESGQLELRRQEVSLEATAHEATELMRPLLAQAELSVSLDFSALQGASVPGDAQRLQQVYVNLLSNAAKFAPRGSTIRIGASRAGARIEHGSMMRAPESPGDPGAILSAFAAATMRTGCARQGWAWDRARHRRHAALR